MKSAYELAMERLQKSKPSVKLNDEQKKQIAEVDSLYKSKIAEREVYLQELIAKASMKGDSLEVGELKKQLAGERKKFEEEAEEKKEKIRQGQS
ncbi:hypothetical protein QPK87_35915 [Kamptonema cortianum]|uniref:Uncharacterized protein n=1 Tax=Geitlerinema calcuttense NRMC-F 0142 TaxID=2922238 RepID=A0ABT7M0R0_9CYAN|nr:MULTISPECIES: hypothetical protein [Cyanophyceae]MDK3161899.1 hypothetical protein [Kamptonema cortianum]MDL5050574.1 hypothetical protein [Oscillatoria amoena NRMC-F 0135]MDL5055590.1 hypothetical protein [Oscillatoria laete-virens NRMC-F 0139]MDL5057844.1 hypothetical protein [Geitlerinema calcuttense NRMC-F 0142]